MGVPYKERFTICMVPKRGTWLVALAQPFLLGLITQMLLDPRHGAQGRESLITGVPMARWIHRLALCKTFKILGYLRPCRRFQPNL